MQLHNVFPAPENHRILVPLIALVSSAAALIGLGWLMRLIFAAQRQIPIVSDTERLGSLGSLSESERTIRDQVFSSVATEHAGTSLRALELEARGAEREAEVASDPATKARFAAKAKRLLQAVDSGLTGAALLIIEERSGNLFRSREPVWAFSLAAIGIIVAFGVADYSKGQRDLIALRKSCAEAEAAGAKDPCESVVAFESISEENANANAATRKIAIGVRRDGMRCRVRLRVAGKATNATSAGMATFEISDFSRYCGAELTGGGLALRSGWRHTGTSMHEVRLKPMSYSLVSVTAREGSTPSLRRKAVAQLVAAP